MTKQTAESEFLAEVRSAIARDAFHGLVLSRPIKESDTSQRLSIRPVVIDNVPRLLIEGDSTGYQTHWIETAACESTVGPLLGNPYRTVRLQTAAADLLLEFNRRGVPRLVQTKPTNSSRPKTAHDRAKQRMVPEDAPFLEPLGISINGRVKPSGYAKYRQIDKFIEILDSTCRPANLESPFTVLDMGCGKAYLTFAIHHYFTARQMECAITGIDQRSDLVAMNIRHAQALQCHGLEFQQGSIADATGQRADILVALHACDTATDQAIVRGIQTGARVILLAPCCHHELRPLLRPPPPLEGMLRHGIHMEREAAQLTDSLRALVLETHGYAVRVFEFIGFEHTGRNTMIAATRTRHPRRGAANELTALKQLFGLDSWSLEQMLLRCGA